MDLSPLAMLKNKIAGEYDSFIEDMKTKSPDLIIASAYQISTMNDINSYVQSTGISLNDGQLSALLNCDNTLGELYGRWLKNGEWNSYDDIGELISYTADRALQRIEEKKHILSEDSRGVQLDGLNGRWDVVKKALVNNKEYYLLKSADNKSMIIADSDRNIIEKDVKAGFINLPIGKRKNVIFSVEHNSEVGMWQNNSMPIEKLLLECALSERPYVYAMNNGEPLGTLEFAQMSQHEGNIVVEIDVDKQNVSVFGGDNIYTRIDYTFDELRTAAAERASKVMREESFDEKMDRVTKNAYDIISAVNEMRDERESAEKSKSQR